MGVVVRQSVKSVFITMAGILLGALVTVLSIRFFPKIEYGFTQNLLKICTQASFLGLFGFNYTVLIYGPRYHLDDPKRSSILTLSALLPLAFSIIIALSFWLFKTPFLNLYGPEDREMMAQLYAIFPLLTLLVVATTWLSFYLLSVQKNALQSLAMEVLFRIAYIALIALYGLKAIDFHQFIWGFLGAWLIPTGYLALLCFKVGKLKFSTKILLSFKEIKELFQFSGYHMLTAVSTVLIFQMDAILLGPLDSEGLEAIAVYSVASLAISMLRNPTRVIANSAVPSFTQRYKEGNLHELKALFDRSCVNMQVIAFGMLAFILLDIGFIKDVVTSIHPGYEAIKWLIIILLIGQVVDMSSGFNFHIISISKYYRFNFWISIALLVIVLGLNFLLIKSHGVYGAAWATTSGMIVFSVAKSVFVWRKLKM